MQKRVLQWADESDEDMVRVLQVLFNNYPNDLALPRIADHSDTNLSEGFYNRIDHLEALGLIRKTNEEPPRVVVVDALFAPYLRPNQR